MRRGNQEPPFYPTILCFGEIFGSKSTLPPFLSFYLYFPPFSLCLSLCDVTPTFFSREDARSILGNTSCQFPMLYKVNVFPYEDRRPSWHTLFTRANRFYFENSYIFKWERSVKKNYSTKSVTFYVPTFSSSKPNRPILIMK